MMKKTNICKITILIAVFTISCRTGGGEVNAFHAKAEPRLPMSNTLTAIATTIISPLSDGNTGLKKSEIQYASISNTIVMHASEVYVVKIDLNKKTFSVYDGYATYTDIHMDGTLDIVERVDGNEQSNDFLTNLQRYTTILDNIQKTLGIYKAPVGQD